MPRRRSPEEKSDAPVDRPGGDVLAAHLFLRGLGAVYLVAFLSLWLQVDGLFGRHGIFPMASYLQAARDALGAAAYWQVPTAFWLWSGEGALDLACALGVAASLAILAGRMQVGALAVAWFLYLSLVSIGRTFLAFQWDNLLLEAGLLAIFLLPPALRRRFGHGAPAPIPLWLLRWLLFRLMVGSGLVKLLSGDLAWRDLSALTYHYETQPMPLRAGYWLHQLPLGFHQASALLMFFVELAVPLLIWAPPAWRRWAFPPLVLLQVAVLLTGNYGFFNLVTLALCLLVLDDGAMPRRLRALVAGRRKPQFEKAWQLSFAPAAALIALLSLMSFAATLGFRPGGALGKLAAAAAPLRSVNGYGLFAVMTKTRDEIFIEGSRDGREWRPYRFRYKCEDPAELRFWLAPHMPRLDWQMWFAALGEARDNPFFFALLGRLAEGRKDVVDLFADNPFPDGPPAFFRARLERWRFTDSSTDPQAFWTREDAGFYLAPTRADRFLPRP